MTLRNAFAHSVNTIAAQLGDEVGIPAIIDTAKRMGVQSALPNVPSLALGSAEVTLMEMTRAFGSVVAGVQSIEPYSIRSISANSQQALYTKTFGRNRSFRPAERQPGNDDRSASGGRERGNG